MFLKNYQKSLCWIHQPFFLSPGGENSPQNKTLHLSIERDKVVHCVRKSKEIFF
jgi:hypothetical protein